MFEERVDSVKCDQNDARDQSVGSLQPLPVGFVGVSWMVTIVTRGLRFGDIAVPLDPIKPILGHELVPVSIWMSCYIRPKEA